MALIKSVLNSGLNAKTGVRIEYIKVPLMENDVLVKICDISNNGESDEKGKSYLIEVVNNSAICVLLNGRICEFCEQVGSYFWDPMGEDSYLLEQYDESIINTAKIINATLTNKISKEPLFFAINKKANPKYSISSNNHTKIKDPFYGDIEIVYNVEYSIKIDNPFIVLVNAIANGDNYLTVESMLGGKEKLNQSVSNNIIEVINSVMQNHNVSFNKIQAYKTEIKDKINELLQDSLLERYGISIDDIIIKLNASESSRTHIEEVDSKSFYYK